MAEQLRLIDGQLAPLAGAAAALTARPTGGDPPAEASRTAQPGT